MTSTATIDTRSVSKWYGNLVAVNDVTLQVGPGITGLLGPNGAGKTTLLNLITGLAAPSEGEVRVLGEPVRDNTPLYRRIGFMPGHESLYDVLTARQFIEMAAALYGLDPVGPAVDRAFEYVALTDVQHRSVATFSRGMRQRTRLAASLVHDPEVLLLDEPMNGTDPQQRIATQDLMRRLGAEGRTVLVSSHILEEIETLTDNILLLVAGKLAAAGDFLAIRAKLDERPYQVKVGEQRHPCDGGRAHRVRRGGLSLNRRGRGTDAADDQHRRGAALASAAGQGAEHTPLQGGTAGRVVGQRVRLLSGGHMTAVLRLSLRQLGGRVRLLFILLLAALPVGLTGLIILTTGGGDESNSDFIDAIVDALLIAGALPIIALVLATASFGNEVEDKTLSYLLLKPVPRWLIALPKTLAPMAIGGPALVVSGVGSTVLGVSAALFVAESDVRAVLAVGVAVLAGVVAYSAVFTWAGLVTTRALAAGLIYVFIWEGFLSSLLEGVRYLSIRAYTLAILHGIDGESFGPLEGRVIELPAAVIGVVVVTVVFFLLTVRRLRKMDVA